MKVKNFLMHGHEILDFMNNIVSREKADTLHSITLARCYCFLRNGTSYHLRMDNYICFCFECSLQNFLCELLVERDDQRYMFHLNVSNYDKFEYVEFWGKVLTANT